MDTYGHKRAPTNGAVLVAKLPQNHKNPKLNKKDQPKKGRLTA